MIFGKNFAGLHTPQLFGELLAFIIPAVTKPVYSPVGIRVVALDLADPAYTGRWIVSDDQNRAWRLALREFKDRDGQVVAVHYLATDEVAVDELLSPNAEYIADFKMTDLPTLSDREYRRCRFSQRVPVDVAGKKRGVRLFPGDDTPRTFIECSLTNCEPPPGSTVVECLTVIKEFALEADTDTITVDGQAFELVHHIDRIHGRFDPATGSYIDRATPEDIEVD